MYNRECPVGKSVSHRISQFQCVQQYHIAFQEKELSAEQSTYSSKWCCLFIMSFGNRSVLIIDLSSLFSQPRNYMPQWESKWSDDYNCICLNNKKREATNLSQIKKGALTFTLLRDLTSVKSWKDSSKRFSWGARGTRKRHWGTGESAH